MSRAPFGEDYSTRELRRRLARGKGAGLMLPRGVAGAYSKPSQVDAFRAGKLEKKRAAK
jgi:hypothetical protein